MSDDTERENAVHKMALEARARGVTTWSYEDLRALLDAARAAPTESDDPARNEQPCAEEGDTT